MNEPAATRAIRARKLFRPGTVADLYVLPPGLNHEESAEAVGPSLVPGIVADLPPGYSVVIHGPASVGRHGITPLAAAVDASVLVVQVGLDKEMDVARLTARPAVRRRPGAGRRTDRHLASRTRRWDPAELQAAGRGRAADALMSMPSGTRLAPAVPGTVEESERASGLVLADAVVPVRARRAALVVAGGRAAGHDRVHEQRREGAAARSGVPGRAGGDQAGVPDPGEPVHQAVRDVRAVRVRDRVPAGGADGAADPVGPLPDRPGAALPAVGAVGAGAGAVGSLASVGPPVAGGNRRTESGRRPFAGVAAAAGPSAPGTGCRACSSRCCRRASARSARSCSGWR